MILVEFLLDKKQKFYIFEYKNINMSKFQTIKGILKTFWQMTKEDFQAMDKKLWRIIIGGIIFILMAYLWFKFFSVISPFKF